MHILGVSAFFHDSAAALVRDGEIVAAAQEERFTRVKHDAAFPEQAVQYCLRQGGIDVEQLDYIGFYEKPFLKFERLLETWVAHAPAGFEAFRRGLPLWLNTKLRLPAEMDRRLGRQRRLPYVFTEHHESHAASAFFPSPYEEAAIVTMDGVGEWATATIGHGRANRIGISREIRFPHSLGMLYSAFTYYCGFEVNSDEYKLMGLAPYGRPVYRDLILAHLIDVKEDGSFWMDMSFFNYCAGLTMTSAKFHDVFGGPPKTPDEPITQRHMDLAASVQAITEEVVLRTARYAHRLTGSKNLCLAGGVALNCVANGRILREGPFENIWIQPAAGDAGGALGVALFVWHQLLDRPRTARLADSQEGSLLGPVYSREAIEAFLAGTTASWETYDTDDALFERAARLLAEGKVVGLFQGRMEYGPRALGSRSIIGDPRNPEMQTIMNLKVKYRESFRPFAPCVLQEHAADYFDVRPGEDSPYMLLVAPVHQRHRRALSEMDRSRAGIDLLKVPRSDIPAVTHVDYSARIQTVDEKRHPRLRALMMRFYDRTGCPVIVNTSFNLSWEPIVNSPREAYDTFMQSDIDALVLEHAVLVKSDQPANREARAASRGGTEHDRAIESLWRCPACGGALQSNGSSAECSGCHTMFKCDDGIWQLFWPHEPFEGDVTEVVREFYERHPFPSYDDHESLRSLISKSRKGVYAKLLADQIPFNARVLEIGCGTGQLSNFLAIGCRTVIGTDLCMNSLRLAEDFRRRQGLTRARFVQMNLFRPAFAAEQFDVVLCNGVLHHTSDPRGGLERIVRLVKPGGHVVVGLYNRFGRWFLDARRGVFRITGGRFRWIDPYLRATPMSRTKRDAWFADQYQHPHESTHTMDEVLGWFDAMGLDFVNAVPKTRPWDRFTDRERLFAVTERGTPFDHVLAQAKLVFTGNREGGFFLMIGRKRGGP